MEGGERGLKGDRNTEKKMEKCATKGWRGGPIISSRI